MMRSPIGLSRLRFTFGGRQVVDRSPFIRGEIEFNI